VIEPGLCGRCRHGRAIRSDRGSTFWLCRRSESDPRFPRYPALPVVACVGFEPGNGAPPRDEPRVDFPRGTGPGHLT
jgi:hypothetical protein